MIATLVHVWVKTEFRKDFIKATLKNHERSIKEPENLRFDVIQDESDANKFVLYEAYKSEQAALAHKDTGHYKEWRDAVAPMMDKPRKGEKHIILAPNGN